MKGKWKKIKVTPQHSEIFCPGLEFLLVLLIPTLICVKQICTPSLKQNNNVCSLYRWPHAVLQRTVVRPYTLTQRFISPADGGESAVSSLNLDWPQSSRICSLDPGCLPPPSWRRSPCPCVWRRWAGWLLSTPSPAGWRPPRAGGLSVIGDTNANTHVHHLH